MFPSASCWSAAFGTLFRRHGSGRARIEAPPRDRVLLARANERMHAEYATDLRLEDLAAGVGLDDLPAHRPVQAHGRAHAACLSDAGPARHGLPASAAFAGAGRGGDRRSASTTRARSTSISSAATASRRCSSRARLLASGSRASTLMVCRSLSAARAIFANTVDAAAAYMRANAPLLP